MELAIKAVKNTEHFLKYPNGRNKAYGIKIARVELGNGFGYQVQVFHNSRFLTQVGGMHTDYFTKDQCVEMADVVVDYLTKNNIKVERM